MCCFVVGEHLELFLGVCLVFPLCHTFGHLSHVNLHPTIREAVKQAGYLLRGEALRAAKAPDLKIEIHESTGPSSSLFPVGACDPCEAGDRSLFFVRPWFW